MPDDRGDVYDRRVQAGCIRHTVAFRLCHARGSQEEEEFLTEAAKLSSIPGVESFEILAQVGEKNEFDYGISMEFRDRVAYDRYNEHPEHVCFVRDWWLPQVADFLEIDYAERVSSG